MSVLHQLNSVRSPRFSLQKAASLSIGFILVSSSLFPTIARTPEVGFEFEGSRTLNQVKITDTNFVGECPGVQEGTVQARFLNEAVPPAIGHRVVVRNVTRGMATEPFTNRNYSEGRTAESGVISFGTWHELKTLNVLEGENDFEYEIRQGDRVVEQGTFSAEFSRAERTRERNAACRTEDYCLGDPGREIKKCRRPVLRTICSCPDGKVVRESSRPYYSRW